MGGNDTITGNGNTRISYVSATGGVTVDLAAGTATGNASVGTDTLPESRASAARTSMTRFRAMPIITCSTARAAMMCSAGER